jgi:hypothetical protein
LRSNEKNSSYGREADWWSIGKSTLILGIVMHEILYDEVPFYSETLVGTYGKIVNHENNFVLPEKPLYSSECKDLISK